MQCNPTALDILTLLVPSERFLCWLRSTLDRSRQKGREPPDSYWRLLERWERLAPHTDAIAANLSDKDWHEIERILFQATKGTENESID